MSVRGGVFVLALVASLAPAGCNGQSGQVNDFGGLGVLDVPARRGTVVTVGCSLDDGQKAALESNAVHRLVSDVIVLCFSLDAQGNVQPSEADSLQAFSSQAAWVTGHGYRAKVGVGLADASQGHPEASTKSPLSSAAMRAKIVASVETLAAYGDGVELDLRLLPGSARDDVTKLVTAIGARVRPKETLGVLVPSELENAALTPSDAADVVALSAVVDRVRVMTLDYSTGGSPGPTIDSGWAIDSARLALAEAGHTPVDLSMPLYGWLFEAEDQKTVSCAKARSLARDYGAPIQRAPSGAPWFSYTTELGSTSEVWFDDAQSTVLLLAAWPATVLPAGVGVVFYGLGSEDPGVWSAVAEATP